MFIMRSLDCKILFVSLCMLHLCTLGVGRPLRKRTVSEVQLMHNLGERKQVQERQDWLQIRLQDIHTASNRASGEASHSRRRLLPADFPGLNDLTPEEIQYALNFLEKLLSSKRS